MTHSLSFLIPLITSHELQITVPKALCVGVGVRQEGRIANSLYLLNLNLAFYSTCGALRRIPSFPFHRGGRLRYDDQEGNL